MGPSPDERARRRAAGECVECQAPAAPRKRGPGLIAKCARHRDLEDARRRRRNKIRKKLHKCQKCGADVPKLRGPRRSCCPSCRRKQKPHTVAQRQRRRDAGICVHCARPSRLRQKDGEPARLCKVCYDRKKARERERKQERERREERQSCKGGSLVVDS